MSYCVKAFCQFPNGDHETRRFRIPLFEQMAYLQDKIRTIFKLENSRHITKWIDEDQDEIHFTSEEDLAEARLSMKKQSNPDILYLTITVEDDNIPTNFHDGIECDECSGPVRGFRYKCLHCDDYDLCMTCESRGTHKVHHMIRIPKKDPRANVTFAELKRTVQHGPNHSGSKSNDKGEATGTTRNSNYDQPAPHPRETFSRRCHRRRMNRPGFWHSFSGADAGGFNRWGRRRGPHNPFFDTETMCRDAAQVAEDASTRAMRHASELMHGIWTGWSGFPAQTAHEDSEDSQNPEPTPASQPPKSTAATEDKAPKPRMATGYPTQALFDPCLISVNTEGVKHRCGFTEEPIDEVQPVTAMIEVIDLSKQDGSEEQAQAMETDISENVSDADGWNLVNDNGSISSTDGATAGTPVMIPTQVTAPIPLTAPTLVTPPTPVTDPTPPMAPTPIQQEVTESVTNSASGPPSLEEPNSSYMSQRIQWALKQMKMMGYTDEGGLLTRLLQEKDGNINETLDALMARKG